MPSRNGRLVLRSGPEGSHDEFALYYGTTIRIGNTFHLWYNGNYGPHQNNIGYERVYCCICYATSQDGVVPSVTESSAMIEKFLNFIST